MYYVNCLFIITNKYSIIVVSALYLVLNYNVYKLDCSILYTRIYGVYNMLIYTYLELYYIYVLYDIIYLLQSVPPSGSVFFLNKRIEYQKTVVRLAYT